MTSARADGLLRTGLRLIGCIMALPAPSEFAAISADGWVNIFEVLGAAPPRISGVDAFLGDENAHTLVLGQDFGPAERVRVRQRSGDPDPYRHFPGLPTNRRLGELLDIPIDGHNAERCGVYYANAIFLLREGERFSGEIRLQDAMVRSQPVLSHVLSSLPKLRRIIAVGETAYQALLRHFKAAGDWRSALELRRSLRLGERGYEVWAASHLGTWGVRNRKPGAPLAECWELIKGEWRAYSQAAS